SLARTRTSGADGNFNFSKVSDPVVDRLTDAMKSETDIAKRNAMIREALLRIKDEVLLIPIHHQMRPWAMKANVTTVHRSDDRPEGRFTSVRRRPRAAPTMPGPAGPGLHGPRTAARCRAPRRRRCGRPA